MIVYLFGRVEGFSGRILICLSIVYFEGGEEGVLESYVESNDGMNDCFRFVSFER